MGMRHAAPATMVLGSGIGGAGIAIAAIGDKQIATAVNAIMLILFIFYPLLIYGF